MPSPKTAALGKFEDIPVSYYTGVPNITVPIYHLTEGSLSLPISLAYHASGIKVGEPANEVGLNWALIGPGLISRTVMGLPDDLDQGYFSSGQSLMNPDQGAGAGGLHICSSNPDTLSEAIIQYYTTLSTQIDDVANGQLDAEPDLFAFNFGNYSGKFYFDKYQQAVFIPRSDIKVKFKRRVINNTPKEIIQFTLITPDGNKYIFGQLDNENQAIGVETTIIDNQNVAQIAPSSWYLRRIISPNNVNEIQLSYEADNFSYKNLASCQVQYFTDGSNQSSCSGIPYGPNTNVHNNEIRGWRLSHITNSTGTTDVDFFYDNDRLDLDSYLGSTPKQLDEVIINSGTFCKTFDFFYSYLISNDNTESHHRRLRLDSLQERSCDNQIELPSWKFDYVAGNLPHRLSKQIDHWGFYNGAAQNEGTPNIPPFSVQFAGQLIEPPYASANRDSEEAFMKIGVLEKITYPTGGHTLFSYEANEIVESVSGDDTFQPIDNEISNCLYPFQEDCCNTFTASGVTSFDSVQLASGPIFRIFVYDADCDGVQRDFPTVTIMVRRTSSPNFGEYNRFQFNTNNCGQGNICSVEAPLSELVLHTPFDPDIDYTFELILDNQVSPGDEDVKASFQLFSTVNGEVSLINKKVGGLRIKKITTHDGISIANDIIREYNYENLNGFSSGKLYFRPSYTGYQNGICIGQKGFTAYATSIAPLSNFNGYHIGYRRVVEKLPQNGQTEFLFIQEQVIGEVPNPNFPNPFAASDSYPFSPDLARLVDGKLKQSKISEESGSLLAQQNSTFNNSYSYLSDHVFYKAYTYPTAVDQSSEDQIDGNQTTRFFKTYRIRTAAPLLLQQVNIQDGVRTTTSFEYDFQQHLAPTAIETSDDRGQPYRTEYKYAFDATALSSPPGILDSMIARNMIITPLQVLEFNNGLAIKGQLALYHFYSRFTGAPTSDPQSPIYPRYFYNYEMTFNANGDPIVGGLQGWEADGSIPSYDLASGQPDAYDKVGLATRGI